MIQTTGAKKVNGNKRQGEKRGWIGSREEIDTLKYTNARWSVAKASAKRSLTFQLDDVDG